ncbi:MAG: hypothetical protein WAN69_17965 [Candidatus Korobacteraceae bacterium]|jgi:hypothetical protein
MTTVATCGKTTINYDESCSYSCVYNGVGFKWSVSCSDGKGGSTTTSGTGIVKHPPKIPSATIAGDLEVCAKMLSSVWKRPVIVPVSLRGTRVRKRTVRGTKEEIAEALGLQLGARQKK